jgi:hypothetical protein
LYLTTQDDADLKNAIPRALGIAFLNGGQACAAGTRLLVRKTARTSGKRRTSATKFASKGEVLSFLHTSANVKGMFKEIDEASIPTRSTEEMCELASVDLFSPPP